MDENNTDITLQQQEKQQEKQHEKYDLFNTDELAELYSKYQPPLEEKVIEIVLSSTVGRDCLVDIGERDQVTSLVQPLLGCGSGSSTRPFCSHFSKVVGVDYSPAQINLAKSLSQQISNVQFVQGSLYELPLADGSVDCIIGVMIAQFIDLPQLFEEAKRVLKPGGVLLFHGKGSPKVVQIERETETKSVTETTVSELNERIAYIKTILFAGLFHDRTYFNPHKYSNIPPLHANQEIARVEWTSARWTTLPDLANYMLTWSAAGKYCAKHGISSGELRRKMIEVLEGGDKGVCRVRCEADRFTWTARHVTGS